MKDNYFFLQHILESISDIEAFLHKVNKYSFFENKEKQNAVIRSLEIIGEAVKHLPDEFKNKHHSIEWLKISGMRDKLIHHYFGVDLDTIWQVVEEDLPKLKKDIKLILEKTN